jgi:hypothetical protein
MNYTQLELPCLEEPQEIRHKREIEQLRISLEKNRRSLHAKHSSLNKLYIEVKHELEVLKAAICKNRVKQDFEEVRKSYLEQLDVLREDKE